MRDAQGAEDLRAALARLEAAVQGGFISPLFRRAACGAPAAAALSTPQPAASGPDALRSHAAAGAGANLAAHGSADPAVLASPGAAPCSPCGAGGFSSGAVACCNPETLNPNPGNVGGPALGALEQVPATAAAVALRLAALDAALAYRPGTRPAREVLPVRILNVRVRVPCV